MVWKRFAKGKRRYRKRRAVGFLDRKYSVKDLAWKAFKGVKYIKGLVNSELLYKDLSAQGVSVDSTGAVVNLVQIAQGDGSTGRTGNSILLKSILARIVMIADSAETSSSWVRLIIFKDKEQTSDTSPGVTDVLVSANPVAPLNRDNAGRFQIMYDKMLSLSVLGANPIFTTKINLFPNCHVRYNGSATSDIEKNGIYMLYISNEPTTTPNLEYYVRVNYHDN